MDHPKVRYPGRRARTEILAEGTRKARGARVLPCDIIWEVDVEIILRDGTVIVADIFRPRGALCGTLPAIVAWSPYGKQEGTDLLSDYPFRAGVKASAVSGYQKWEGPDPAYWCAHGYAVVNPEARGAYGCEGDIVAWGPQEATDGHDVIEWIAAQPWCSGKVGLSGNSWLAISQWFIAATRPAHLAAIAPWEGFTDLYHHHLAIGGVPDSGFSEFIFGLLPGNSSVEDVTGMLERYPLYNTYWQTKSARVQDIEVPAYVVASWTNFVHTPGTFSGWQKLGSEQKWLRVHDTMEWADYYQHEDDLRRFFDHFLRGQPNGWETTPPVRLAVVDPGRSGTRQLTSQAYPLPDIPLVRHYLDARTFTIDQSLSPAASTAAYLTASDRQSLKFRYTFKQACDVLGAGLLRLYISADAVDTDVFVKVRPLDARGKQRWLRTIPLKGLLSRLASRFLLWSGKPQRGFLFYDGMRGRLRASRRNTFRPDSAHASLRYDEPVEMMIPGDIVCLNIELTPLGMHFEPGDMLEVEIAGHTLSPWPLPDIAEAKSSNHGIATVHTGGSYPSCLMLALRAASVEDNRS